MTTGRYVIVNADDFGYCQRRNAGIIHCVEEGVVSSISVLMNGCAKNEAKLLETYPNLSIGLHFNISEGSPLSPISSIPTLVNEQNHFLGKFNLHEATINGKIAKEEVEIELKAQIEHFKKLMDCSPTHIDGHQHVHVFPGIREVFAKVLHKENIKWTRMPIDKQVETCDWLENNQRQFYKLVTGMAEQSDKIFSNYGLNFTDSFIGTSCMGNYMTISRLRQALLYTFGNESGNHSCEIMVHPGYVAIPGIGGCGGGPDDFALSAEREHEITVLCNQDWNKFLTNENIKLISFKELN